MDDQYKSKKSSKKLKKNKKSKRKQVESESDDEGKLARTSSSCHDSSC